MLPLLRVKLNRLAIFVAKRRREVRAEHQSYLGSPFTMIVYNAINYDKEKYRTMACSAPNEHDPMPSL